uniref:non-specific serine/threonine protein kinase n=1 Tax=Fagus sylvatica TaxID=28930 RepID=A0A2N9EIH4_FAGSY
MMLMIAIGILYNLMIGFQSPQTQPYIPLSNDNAYNIPDVVLKTAAKTQNASIPLTLYWSPPDSLSKCYVYFHFAEIEKLEAGQQRELKIDSQWQALPDRISEGTKLPPILNAVEIFVLKELPNKPTAIDDVEAIMEIKELYRVAKHWQGDPCVPSEFSWDGLNCSNNNPPRIISLRDCNFILQSESTAVHLPEFLAQLPNLTTLDLSGNKLTGPIPEVLLKMSRDRKLVLRTSSGCTTETIMEKPYPKTAEMSLQTDLQHNPKSYLHPVSRIIGLDLILIRILYTVTISNIKSQNQQYTYSEVLRITNNYKTIIGGGGFGKVYLGKLKDETQVAVKFLSNSSNQGYREFRAEAQLLMIVHHRNLVSLVGYCDEGEKKALIYEYMANGNLQQHLSVTNTNVLTWNERLHIAVDAAHGLEYLHNGCKPPIIHRDLKPSNILLNEHMQAKIADFGLSRAFASESDSHVSTRPAGTLGYLDPEFQASGNFNKKSDVYSFGIILFELITGRPAIVRGPVQNNHVLDWVKPLIERGDVQNVVDPRLEGEFSTSSAWRAIEIAMSCVPSFAIQRPDMSHVLAELKECLALEMGRGRTQRMANEGNKTTASIPFKMTHLEYESDIAPHAR